MCEVVDSYEHSGLDPISLCDDFPSSNGSAEDPVDITNITFLMKLDREKNLTDRASLSTTRRQFRASYSRCYNSVFRSFYPFRRLMWSMLLIVSMWESSPANDARVWFCYSVREVFRIAFEGSEAECCHLLSKLLYVLCQSVYWSIAESNWQTTNKSQIFERIFHDCGCESPHSVQARRVESRLSYKQQ